MAIIKAGQGDAHLVVDSSNAARITKYTSQNEPRAQKYTYCSTNPNLSSPTGTTPFFVLIASGSKKIKIQKVFVTLPASGSGLSLYGELEIRKYVGVPDVLTGMGSSTTRTITPYDSNAPVSTASCISFTGAPTLHTQATSQILYSQRIIVGAAAAASNKVNNLFVDFKSYGEASPAYLTNAGEVLGIGWRAALGTQGIVAVSIQWTEESF